MKLARILLASVAILTPALTPGWSGLSAATSQQRKFSPPREDIVLSRTVIRRLVDGKQISVTRRYRVRFIPLSDGYRLDGALIDVRVEVPPVLEKLAEIERRRQDIGLFPVRINSAGVVVDQDTSVIDRDSRRQNVVLANDVIAESGLDPAFRQELVGLVTKMAYSTPNSPWPVDMFRAQPGEHRQVRQVTLSNGSQGEIDVLFRVGDLLPCGLPGSIERIITTRFSGTERVSREIWTIAPVAG